MPKLGATAVIAALLAALALSSGARAEERIVVTRDSISLPAGCTARGLAAFADEFLGAFNRGEWSAVDQLFAAGGPGPPDFQFFAWRQDTVRERDRIVAYLDSLRERGERFRLLSLRAATVPTVPASAAITYLLERPGGFVFGKGLIDCTRQRIWQWAMAPGGGPTGPCPAPAGWGPSGPIVACTAGRNAVAVAPHFTATETAVSLPRRCAPDAARRRVVAALSAFNLGEGGVFAEHFVRLRPEFHPYTRSIRTGIVGRARIARFVPTRYNAGDGWSAVRLLPPQGTVGLPRTTVYGLELSLTSQGAAYAARAASKLVVDCASGLLERWVGPGLKRPPSG